MAKLASTWVIKQSTIEPHTVIHVSNLQTSIPAVADAWGRHRGCQPALITCAVSLKTPFFSASHEDAVTTSTVHYGTLSKAILEACHDLSRTESKTSMRLGQMLHHIQCWLTSIGMHGESNSYTASGSVLRFVAIESLLLEIALPKASLLGSAVKMSSIFRYNEDNTSIVTYSMMLELCQLRIPTLIGVNTNERYAKQMVIISVQIDRYGQNFDELFNEVELIIVKSTEESSFKTLEALSSHLAQRIFELHIRPQAQLSPDESWPTIRLTISKPTAVTLADAPTVEMLFDPQLTLKNAEKLLASEPKHFSHVRLPYQLQGRLDEWIKGNMLNDT